MPYKQYIDGEWCDSSSGGTFEIKNPATGETVATYPYGDAADAKRAMDAAEREFPIWKMKSPYERAAFLNKTAALIRERATAIAAVLTAENGKTLGESMGSVNGCAAWFEWFAEEGKRAYGRMIPSMFGNKRHWVIQQPVGVVVAVSPWNFPVNLMSRKLAAGLAAGCTVVTRPASNTALSSMLILECLHEAGFPKGTVSLVTGPSSESNALFLHKACRKVSFTGSTAVGREIMKTVAPNITKLSLELGGNAPLIVFPDVDVKASADTSVVGKFRNAGQSCIAPQRIFVHKTIFAEFTKHVVEKCKAYKVGNGTTDGVDMGPLFNKKQFDTIDGFVKDAVAKGATVLCGGARLTGGEYDKGYFYPPTVLTNITNEMRVMTEEVFGPVMPLLEFEDEADVIQRANDTEYGLAGYVLCKDINIATRVAEALEFGVIGLNDTVPTVPNCPFGGIKASGFGREGGIEGLQAYMETKYISCAGY